MKHLINLIAKYWHPKNLTRDPLSTFIGLMLMIGASYFFFEGKIDFTQYMEALIAFLGLCGINLINRGGNGAAVAGMLALLLLNTGCKRPPQSSIQSIIKDSTYVETVMRHDTVLIKGDSVKIIIPSPCVNYKNPTQTPTSGEGLKTPPLTPPTRGGEHSTTSTKVIKKKQGKAEITATQHQDGSLEIDCKCDGYQAVIDTQDKIITKLRSEINNKHTVVTERYTAWYDWLARSLALALILIIIFTILSKFR